MLGTTSILFISAAFLYLTTHCICHSSKLCIVIHKNDEESNYYQNNNINKKESIPDSYKLVN